MMCRKKGLQYPETFWNNVEEGSWRHIQRFWSFPTFFIFHLVSNLSQPSWNHLSPRLKSLLVGLRRWKMEERKIVFGHMLIQLWLWYNGTSNQRPVCHFTSKPTTMMSMPSSSSSSSTVRCKWKNSSITYYVQKCLVYDYLINFKGPIIYFIEGRSLAGHKRMFCIYQEP